MAQRSCPSCSASMKPFQAGRVELEAVLGKKIVPTFSPESKTSRKCAACSKPMVPAELGGLRIEVCRTDRGVFLDENELVALNGGKKVTLPQQQAAPPMPEAKVKDDVSSWLESLGV